MKNNRIALVAGSLALLVMAAGTAFYFSGSDSPSSPQTLPGNQVYKVRPGDNLRDVASQNGLVADAVFVVNEPVLIDTYDRNCASLSEAYKNGIGRHGTYCNIRYRSPAFNTLKPGQPILLPPQVAPDSIMATVSRIKGERVALILDETSIAMTDARQITALYIAALHQSGKTLMGVFPYAIDRVWQYGQPNTWSLGSDRMGTLGALELADIQGADAIIVVSDQPMSPPSFFAMADIHAQIIAHCVDGVSNAACKPDFSKVPNIGTKDGVYAEN